MTALTTPRKMMPAVTALLALCSGCGLSPLSLLGNLLGASGGPSSDAVYFSVYNFYENPVQVEVTYRDRDGVQHTRAVTKDGVSPIPADSRGTLSILVDELTTQPDALLNVKFTFPEDGGAEATWDVRREWLPRNHRARFGVIGTDKASIGWFVDG